MSLSKKYPNLPSAESIQKFRHAFLAAFHKLNDNATKQIGLDEIDNILTEHAESSEHISLVLNLLSENDDHQKIGVRRESLKILGIMAKVFQDKLLEFVPKIISLLTRKLKENNPQIHDCLSDAIGSVVGFGLRNLEVNEACKHINTILRSFYSLFESSNKYTQIGSAICISKIIQCSPVECLYILADELFQRFTNLLQTSTCKAHLQLFECILSLILGIEDNVIKLKANFQILLPVVMDNLGDSDWNVRKIAVEVIYTLTFILKDTIAPNKQEILSALNNSKTDKVRNVREIASTTINFLKGLSASPNTDLKDVSNSPPQTSQTEREKEVTKKEGIVYVSFGKSDQTLKKMIQQPLRPAGDIVNFEKFKTEEDPQEKTTHSKYKNKLEKNPNFFKTPNNKEDVEIFINNKEKLNTSDIKKSPADLSQAQNVGIGEGTFSSLVAFLEGNDTNKGIRTSSAEKKAVEEAVQSHRRQISEQDTNLSNSKLLLTQKSKIEDLSKNREHLNKLQKL